MCEKYPIIKRSSESRKGFPFLNAINPLHLFTDKKEFLCACNHMLPVASHRQTVLGKIIYFIASALRQFRTSTVLWKFLLALFYCHVWRLLLVSLRRIPWSIFTINPKSPAWIFHRLLGGASNATPMISTKAAFESSRNANFAKVPFRSFFGSGQKFRLHRSKVGRKTQFLSKTVFRNKIFNCSLEQRILYHCFIRLYKIGLLGQLFDLRSSMGQGDQGCDLSILQTDYWHCHDLWRNVVMTIF